MSSKKYNFGHIIKQARKDHNLTQEQLAEKLDISTRYMMSVECGNRTPSLSLFFKIIRTLEIDANQIIYRRQDISDTEQARTTLLNLASSCNTHELAVLIATARALLNDQS